MSETLAIDGGVPVRDTEASKWPTWPDNTKREWEEEIVPILKEVYLDQTEGLPAPVGHRFGQAFAAYCDAAYGVMMPSGTTSIAAGLSAALDLDGTEFQRLVWSELARIPFGATSTYGATAEAIGRPAAARAVGAATGRNPAPVIVPCHRVVGASGSLTGFAGGLDTKRALLAHEAEVAGTGRKGRLPGF